MGALEQEHANYPAIAQGKLSGKLAFLMFNKPISIKPALVSLCIFLVHYVLRVKA